MSDEGDRFLVIFLGEEALEEGCSPPLIIFTLGGFRPRVLIFGSL